MAARSGMFSCEENASALLSKQTPFSERTAKETNAIRFKLLCLDPSPNERRRHLMPCVFIIISSKIDFGDESSLCRMIGRQSVEDQDADEEDVMPKTNASILMATHE